ncbi:MAG: hypothetical protein KDD62_05745, partial [Bdellovibrionales bacterium]|nr:hypothetical protein [Bdellovibrionales bacterium]
NVGDVIKSDQFEFGVVSKKFGKVPDLSEATITVGFKETSTHPREQVAIDDPKRAERLYKVTDSQEVNMGGALSWPSSWQVTAAECDTNGDTVSQGEKIKFNMSGFVYNLVEKVELMGHVE